MILAVIPARGGSKGIPGKNIKDLYGQPLISYTIQAALDCKKIDRVVVSTDSEEIAGVAKKYGRMFRFYVRQHWQWIPRKRLMRL